MTNPDPETLGGCRASILAIRNPRARTTWDARLELARVHGAQERDDLVDSERQWLQRRQALLRKRIEGDPRYMVVGARKGGLTVAEKSLVITHREIIQAGNRIRAALGTVLHD